VDAEHRIKIVFLQFAVTGGIASALIVGIWALNRSRVGYSRWLRLVVSGIAAFGMAPSSIWPNDERTFIVSPAALVAYVGLSETVRTPPYQFDWINRSDKRGDWAFALKYGFVPWFITSVLIYEVWKRCEKAKAQKVMSEPALN
jgi:hypothetical protein